MTVPPYPATHPPFQPAAAGPGLSTINLVVSLDDRSIALIVNRVVDAITKELKVMSGTLEEQVQAATATIQSDIAGVATDIQNLGTVADEIKTLLGNLGTITPGSQLTQANVDALNQAANSATALKAASDAAVANLQAIANPGTVTNPGTTATP